MSGEVKHINKSAIKTFAIEARKILMKSAETEAGLYGISADEIRTPIQKGADFEIYETLAGTEKRIYRADMRRRFNLVKAIQEKGFQEVIEETAYTWFNRLIAIRFMEVNDYLPTRTRVLSSETGNNTPDLINDFLDVDLGMTEEELRDVQMAKEENRYDDAFRMLFIKECNALNDILPGLFEKTDDYMELLLNIPYTSDGVVRMLIDTIPEENFNVEKEGQIEIIGWLYQYYNTEPKAKAFAKKSKITKEEIPAVTQLFTPDWIVRYMVENSLGRLWIEGHPDEDLKSNWKYYLDEAKQEPEVEQKLAEIREEYKKLTPEDIKVIDPCMGSGHILVYLFEVLMQIYKQDGYTERDAAELILEKNLYGLDIDDRAYQLSYFAVMMKARQYNRNILKKHPTCHVYAIQESNSVNRKQLDYFGSDLTENEKKTARAQMEGLLDTFIDGKEYGSILKVENYDWDLLRRFVSSDAANGQMNFETYGIDVTKRQLEELVNIGEVLAQKYEVVVTNPPYASTGDLSVKVNNFVKKYYQDSRFDLFAVFIERCEQFVGKYGYQAMITQHSWMFLSSYEKLRIKVLNMDIVNMAHLGSRAFDEIGGEIVQTTSFVIRKNYTQDYKGIYYRLTAPTTQQGKENMFLAKENGYIADRKKFSEIPRNRLGYWASDLLLEQFQQLPLSNYADTRRGLQTGNSAAFIRCWFEPSVDKIDLSLSAEARMSEKKWLLFNSGGPFRKWYGNIVNVVNWENNGFDIKSTGKAIIPSEERYFAEVVSWNKISSGQMSVRYQPYGIIPGDASPFLHSEQHNQDIILFCMAVLNSKVSAEIVKILSPTLNFEVGNIAEIPISNDAQVMRKVIDLAKDEIKISKADWDSFEISWNFKRHPMITRYKMCDAYNTWKAESNLRFTKSKNNEEEINRLLLCSYGLQDELSSVVEDKYITVYSIFDKKEDVPQNMKGSKYVYTLHEGIVSFISYAVGCMFGRYSLDKEGLAYAGGDWDDSIYQTFKPDADAIIPITDEDYGFTDDIVERFIDFVRVVYGEDTLEENLEFIAKALGNKGSSYKEVLRNYFQKDFYKDHCNTYSVTGSGKRPIYWLFDSGKQNGFKALIYIHRYTPDTVGRIRSVYLSKVQGAIENALQNAEYIISTTSSATERAAASRQRDKYIKQINELKPYYQALSHIALQRVEMDLDDGVKKNYQLFQNVEISTEGKKQSLNLLAKI